MKKSFIKKVLEIYTEYISVYGPYTRKDGRKIIVLYDGKNKRTTKQFARIKMEVFLGRKLTNGETVDHIDRDVKNDKLNNLQVLSREEHSKKDAIKRLDIKANCVLCGKEFVLTKNQVNSRAKSKAGPFCSKTCSGKYGSSISNGNSKIKRSDIKIIYYR